MAEILGTGKQRAGKGSRVAVGTNRLADSKWTANGVGDDLDTNNFESAGYDEGILGFVGVEIAFGGNWDAGFNAFDDPPGVYPRDDLQNLQFFTNVLDNVGWLFPYARLRSANTGAEAKGLVTFDASGKSQGPFVQPTGSL